jgi:hypothetical protein
MISTALARALRDSGLVWHPESGDAFRIDRVEADTELFILSEMTVEAHEFPTGTVLGFNGTTEWALDSIDIEDALWMPSEAQLREQLGETFLSLSRDGDGFRLSAQIAGSPREFVADDAADAYARALLALLDIRTVDRE